MPSSTSRHAWHEPARAAALWTGLLAGPLVWLALLEANYVLSYVGWETRHKWVLHVTVAVAVVLVAAAGYIAWRFGPPEDTEARSAPVTRATAELRARWMAAAGVGSCILFIAVILATDIPVLVLKTCQ
jgi:hypothetical protein